MIRLLLLVGAIGYGGHVSLLPPASMWWGFFAVCAGLGLLCIALQAALDWLNGGRDRWAR